MFHLMNRKQYAFYNGVSSERLLITCGVPQGSVLVPLLFHIYINDLPNISDKLNFFLFADDTNIYFESDDLLTLERTVNNEIKKLCLWLNVNRLALNVSKTNFVIFRANKPLYHNVTLIMNRKAIEQTSHVKYLGVYVDEHLNWKYHIAHVAKKIGRGIGILAKLRQFLTPQMLRNVYYCLVYSYLAYGVHVWGSAAVTALNNLAILQKKAVRILSGNQYFQIQGEPYGPLPASDPLFKNLEILKLYDIFQLNVAKFVYETLIFESPPNFWNWFKYCHEVHAYATTSSTVIHCDNYFDIGTVETTFALRVDKCKLVKFGGRLMKVLGPQIWNKLPTYIQESTSVRAFKKEVKAFYIDQYAA